MTLKEQARRILKAAPHLPTQTFICVAILFLGIPMLLHQMFDSGFIQRVETEAKVVGNSQVQDRTRNGRTEYFYYIHYGYNVNGQKFTIPFEDWQYDRDYAEDRLKKDLSNLHAATIWYNQADPSNATFGEHAMAWPEYFGILCILLLPLLYFRWIMLKYYELELEEES